MTEGKPLRLIMRFSAPLLLVNILQLFYTMADSTIVGRILGVDAFASIGATASLYWLVLSAVISMSHGFGIILAQRFGAGDMAGFRKAFFTAFCLAALLSALIGCVGALGSGFLLRLLNTPPELQHDAFTYLSWLFGGIVIAFMYNLLGAALRALGDSRTPLYAMILASVLNIALDFLLVIPLGVIGIAAATLLAQMIACALCLFILHRSGILKGGGRKWESDAARELLRLGLPLGFCNAVIEIGGLVVQRYINGYGVEFVAGISLAKRMYSLLMAAGGAIEAAVATFTAQNFGAGKLERVKQGVSTGLYLMLISAAAVMAVTLPFKRFILGLMLEGEPVKIGLVLDIGTKQLTVLAIGLPVVYLLFLYRSVLQGIGKPFIPVLTGFCELIFRIVSVWLLTPVTGEWGILLSDPSGWAAAAGLLLIAYYSMYKKRLNAPL